jgi:hypothetical protein
VRQLPGQRDGGTPSRQAINALTSGDSQQVMADLFPAGQTAAQNTYLAAISSYPAAPNPGAECPLSQARDQRSAAAQPATPTMCSTSTRAKGWSWYCG